MNLNLQQPNYPSNSHASRAKKKKTLGDKMADIFIGDENTSIGDYLLYDMLIPAAKDIFFDVIGDCLEVFRDGIGVIFFGDDNRGRSYYSSRRRKNGKKTITSYDRCYKPDNGRSSHRGRTANRPSFDELLFDTRAQAKEVRDLLLELLDTQGEVTVGDYYEIAGYESASEFTDEGWGWTNLRNADIKKIADSYTIRLPKPKPLD